MRLFGQSLELLVTFCGSKYTFVSKKNWVPVLEMRIPFVKEAILASVRY